MQDQNVAVRARRDPSHLAKIPGRQCASRRDRRVWPAFDFGVFDRLGVHNQRE
ncbi:uncharacterized protein METZ01_LOCUS85516 [marine metagenome]|uniref:Uncharacterized protein n=1 Tax=marine metagenome TaxID=408172 RepID=A0A381UX03_9ZZZZ